LDNEPWYQPLDQPIELFINHFNRFVISVKKVSFQWLMNSLVMDQ